MNTQKRKELCILVCVSHIQCNLTFCVFLKCGTQLTKMQEDLLIIPLHAELVFTEELMVLLLFDLCHNVFSLL